MIIDVPSGNDFTASGIAFLNLAWDAVSKLELQHADIDEEWDSCAAQEISDSYWAAAQRPLAVAVSLAQQGAEFLLKARVAHASPFLLISGDPRDWPKQCEKIDTAFSRFKTIDAQDLMRACDTVTSSRLPESFKQYFEKLRTHRNTVMHTVDKSLRFTSKEVFGAILEIGDVLVAPKQWMQLRKQYLESTPASEAWSKDHVIPTLVREMTPVVNSFAPAEQLRYFGLHSGRRYVCQSCRLACWNYADCHPEFAQLHPNTPESTSVHCILCGQDTAVERKACVHPGCKGNVIETQDSTCLTCLTEQ